MSPRSFMDLLVYCTGWAPASPPRRDRVRTDTVSGTYGTMSTTGGAAFQTNYDADLKCMSPLVDGDACGSHPGSLKDLHRSHFPAPSSPTDTPFLIGTDGTVWTTMWGAFRPDHDADLKRLSALVEPDACCSHPECLKDLHRAHCLHLPGCDYGGGP